MQERVSAAAAAAAFRGVKRACYSGLDSVALRLEIAARTLPVLPREACALPTLDPETGLITHAVGDGLDGVQIGRFFNPVYLYEEAGRFVDLGRANDRVRTLATPDRMRAPARAGQVDAFTEWLASCGLRLELRAAFADRGSVWGALCLMRESGALRFTSRELDFVRRLGPHVARGLRAAALVETAREDGTARPASTARPPDGPGMLVVDGSGRIEIRSQVAARYLQDLADVGLQLSSVPSSVVSLIGRLRATHAVPDALLHDEPLAAELRARGRSGCWYRLHAALAEPQVADSGVAMVVIEPVERPARAPLLARMHGLSPREWEVVSLVARGYRTADIAARLRLSPHTVQDHVNHACDKIGARGRRQLLARLFLAGGAGS